MLDALERLVNESTIEARQELEAARSLAAAFADLRTLDATTDSNHVLVVFDHGPFTEVMKRIKEAHEKMGGI